MSTRRALLAAPLLLLAAAAAGEDLGARADLTAQRDESAGATDTFWRQVYQLNYQHRFSEPISYRLQLRYQEDRGHTDAAGTMTRLVSRLASPSAGLSWQIPEARLTAGWDLSWGSELDPQTGTFDDRSLARLQASAGWHPWKPLELGLFGDRIASTDAASGIGTTDQQGGASLDLRAGTLRAGLQARATRFEDQQSHVSRSGTGTRGTLDYGRALGPVTVNARYQAEYLRYRDAASFAGATIPVLLTPLAGLYVQTDLPIDTASTPMVPLAGLVDRNVTAAAGVPLGPDGASFQNLGLDLGRFVAVDELQIYVRGPAGTPVASGGPVTFAVYTSADGTTWVPVDGPAAAFSTSLSAYLVTFPAVSTRWVKAVSFGVNTVQTDVTELMGWAHEQPTRSATLNQSFGLSLSWQVVEQVALAYSGQANLTAQSPEGRPTQRSQDVFNQAAARVGPFGPLSFQLTQSQQSSSRVGAPGQGTVASGVSARWDPVPRLSATAEARRAEVRVGGERSFTTTGAGSVQAVLLDTLRADLSAGLSHQQLTGGGTSDFLTASGTVRSRPLEALDLNLLLSAQRTYSSSGDLTPQETTPQFRIAQYQRYLLEAMLHPGEQAALSVRLGWIATPTQSGFAQSWNLSWNPFPGGAVLLAFDYNEDIDPLSGQHFRRASATPRWTLNRHAYLELGYNFVQATGPTNTRSQNLYLTLSVNL